MILFTPNYLGATPFKLLVRIDSQEIVPKGVVASKRGHLDPRLNHNPSTKYPLGYKDKSKSGGDYVPRSSNKTARFHRSKKESRTVLGAIRLMEKSLPFKIKGFASGNGNEFLNHDLHSYFVDRKDKAKFVRRRQYKKTTMANPSEQDVLLIKNIRLQDRSESGG